MVTVTILRHKDYSCHITVMQICTGWGNSGWDNNCIICTVLDGIIIKLSSDLCFLKSCCLQCFLTHWLRNPSLWICLWEVFEDYCLQDSCKRRSFIISVRSYFPSCLACWMKHFMKPCIRVGFLKDHFSEYHLYHNLSVHGQCNLGLLCPLLLTQSETLSGPHLTHSLGYSLFKLFIFILLVLQSIIG